MSQVEGSLRPSSRTFMLVKLPQVASVPTATVGCGDLDAASAAPVQLELKEPGDWTRDTRRWVRKNHHGRGATLVTFGVHTDDAHALHGPCVVADRDGSLPTVHSDFTLGPAAGPVTVRAAEGGTEPPW